MSVLWMILVGLVVGLLARAFMPGRDPAGIVTTIVLGIAGSFAAGFVGEALGLYESGEAAGLLASVLGAMLILFIYRLAFLRRGGRI